MDNVLKVILLCKYAKGNMLLYKIFHDNYTYCLNIYALFSISIFTQLLKFYYRSNFAFIKVKPIAIMLQKIFTGFYKFINLAFNDFCVIKQKSKYESVITKYESVIVNINNF